MLQNLVLPSTLLLTLLLAIGLFFFVKASVKDRTQQIQLRSSEPESVLLQRLEQYMRQRAYQIKALDSAAEQVTYEGIVRPSWFLAIFLGLLTAAGLLCLGLVLSLVLPGADRLPLGLVLLAPLASGFYWQRAKRPEQVLLKVQPTPPALSSTATGTLLTVTAHRDELAQLQSSLGLQPQESAS